MYEQQIAIDKIKSLGGINAIYSVFNEMEKLYVSILGEPIIDEYVFCQPEGISSKSPSISAKYLYKEQYSGGSLAVANAVANFVKGVNLFLCHGELKKEDHDAIRMNQKVNCFMFKYKNINFPKKTRFIESDKSQRIFEITDIKQELWTDNNPAALIEMFGKEDADLNILCDFGHGLFEHEVLASMSNLKKFTALNCQTNSSNFGFNPFTKHKRFDYLSIDLREARVAFHDRFSTNIELFNRLNDNTVATTSMTLGAKGSFFQKDDNFIKSPSFSCKVVDATGAGDAYYAITSLLVKLGCKEEFIPFIGNVYAGLNTKIIGNKKVVSKQQLLKTLMKILK